MSALDIPYLQQVLEQYKSSIQSEGSLHDPTSDAPTTYNKIILKNGRSPSLPHYKTPIRFKRRDARWINDALYNYIEKKLDNRYTLCLRKSVINSIKSIFDVTQHISKRKPENSSFHLAELEKTLARRNITLTHFDFLDLIEICLGCTQYRPQDVRWMNTKLHKYIYTKLVPKFLHKKLVSAIKFVKYLYSFSRAVRIRTTSVHSLKIKMAHLQIVRTHNDFYQFIYRFTPSEVSRKIIPVNWSSYGSQDPRFNTAIFLQTDNEDDEED